MGIAFQYSIIVNGYKSEDADAIVEVFRSYGLNPVTDKDSVSTFETITLTNGKSNTAFAEEFTDAVWHALGRFAEIQLAYTYVEEPDEFVRFDRSDYDRWNSKKEKTK